MHNSEFIAIIETDLFPTLSFLHTFNPVVTSAHKSAQIAKNFNPKL